MGEYFDFGYGVHFLGFVSLTFMVVVSSFLKCIVVSCFLPLCFYS